jgi:hypothetical protein
VPPPFQKVLTHLKNEVEIKEKKQAKKLFVKLIFINRKLFEKFLLKQPPNNGVLQ